MGKAILVGGLKDDQTILTEPMPSTLDKSGGDKILGYN
jgi:hypothetical protein